MPNFTPQPIQKLAVGQRLYNFGFTDSVLFTEAYMRPRYKGSKLIGAKINEYTDYSQLTAEEYTTRLDNDISNYSGINPFPSPDGNTSGNNNNNFIRTTKPMDGSFPPLFEIYGHNNPLYADRINKLFFKGNYVNFPVRGTAYIWGALVAGGPRYTDPIISKQQLFNQKGYIKAKDGGSLEPGTINGINYAIGQSIVSWECQWMGGYRRDRSYGRNPVIEVKTSTIYEFDWGGSTYPEIEKGGSVHIKQILNVDSYAKGNPNVYIVNEATNDSFRVDTTTVNGQGVSIVTDNPTEETDFSINLKRSLAYNDVITLDSYAPPLGPVSGPDSVVGGVNALIAATLAATPPFPTKNVITLEPGIGVPSYGGIYAQRKLGTESNYTSSLTGEPVGVPFLPKYEFGHPNYVGPNVTSDPRADFYMANSQNPGGPDVLASTLRNVSGSYYMPTLGVSSIYPFAFSVGGENPQINSGILRDDTNYLKILPEGVYTTGSKASPQSIYNELSSSLANDNRHFVSFYGTLGNSCVGDLNQIGEPIEISRIDKVVSVYPWILHLKDQPPITGSIGQGDIGILVWKAQQGPFAVMKPTNITADFSYNNLREGGFYREHSTSVVKRHFKNIVETVGIKPSI